MTSPYTPSASKVYELAVKTVPGLVSARDRQAPLDAKVLFDAYMETAREQQMSAEQAWSILFNAAIHWVHQLVRARSANSDKSVSDILFGMGIVAASWTP